jgi:beta-propeller repeat-containing protein
VTKLNGAGSALVYSSHLGGDGAEEARAVALDSEGNAYVTGQTTSSDFPVINGFEAIGGGTDGFLTKVNSAGSAGNTASATATPF